MKRIGFIVAAVVVILLLIAGVPPSPDTRNAPRFVPGKTQPVGNYTWVHYDWHTVRPFVNDKVWIFGRRNRTNQFNCLYDLRERMILGELTNGGVILSSGDGKKLLIGGRNSPAIELKERVLGLLQKISGGKINLNNNQTESFWVLNLDDNAAKRVGSVSQYTGTSSSWYGSPQLQYGCTRPTTEGGSFALFNFADDSFTRVPLRGQLRGWWDDQNVFLEAENHDFILYDVERRQTTTLFRANEVHEALERWKLPSDPANVVAFANWNGREYDFYLAEKDYERQARKCFLLKIERTTPRPTLKLVSPDFQFAWGGRFNAEGTHFLYQGESGGPGSGGNGAVYLRDLSDNSVRTLVPPDNKGRYAIPRFYGDEVIYFRDRVLWRIGLDGSNNVPLFPTNAPPESQGHEGQ
ncbi:MAG TPA: hypothetical protein VFZ59_27650 [Verrucomicrobiae bacterium]|nr:hypothetical protein [Verrucomicrobiae bacterium]